MDTKTLPSGRDRAWRSKEEGGVLLLGSVFLLGAAFRIMAFFRQRGMWNDEWAISSAIDQLELWQVPFRGLNGQSAPIAWVFAVRMSTSILGNGDLAFRLPSLLAGIGTLGVCWVGSYRWFTSNGFRGLFLLLCAISPPLVFYSQEAKQYSFDAFAVAIAMLILTHPRSLFRYKLLSIASVGLMSVVGGLVMFLVLLTRQVHSMIRSRPCGPNAGTEWIALGSAAVTLGAQGIYQSRVLGSARQSLRDWWDGSGFPVKGNGLVESVAWFFDGIHHLLVYVFWPGSRVWPGFEFSGLGLVIPALCLIAFLTRNRLGVLAAGFLVVGVGLAVMRLYPFFGRLVLWLVIPVIGLICVGLEEVALRVSSRLRVVLPALTALFAILLQGFFLVNESLASTYRQFNIHELAAFVSEISATSTADFDLLVSDYDRLIVDWYRRREDSTWPLSSINLATRNGIGEDSTAIIAVGKIQQWPEFDGLTRHYNETDCRLVGSLHSTVEVVLWAPKNFDQGLLNC